MTFSLFLYVSKRLVLHGVIKRQFFH